MKISQAFPSKYLRAVDLPDGEQVRVSIDRVAIEDVAGNNDPEDQKPVVYFSNKNKGLVLNKTNANTIAGAYGDEADEWKGKWISLYSTETGFQGRMVPCIRVKIPSAKEKQATIEVDDLPF